MKLRFTKMHGAGNDFVMLNAVARPLSLSPAQLRTVADRHIGVGADQILVVEASEEAGIDFGYRIFNSDGGEVEQCGNGARCFVKFVHDQGLSSKRRLRVRTRSGVIEPQLEASGDVTVDMGAPEFEPARVPFDSKGLSSTQVHLDTVWQLPIKGRELALSVLSMGNPHAVQWLEDIDGALVGIDGPALETNAHFPNRVNAGFAQVLTREHVRLRVWERGAGETLACGTGACAAVVAGIRRGLLNPKVKVDTRGGQLIIEWEGAQQAAPLSPVMMTGPAVKVFEGELEI